MTLPDEVVEYDIVFEAQKALISLAELNKGVRSFDTLVTNAQTKINAFAKDMGMSFGKAKETLQGVDSLLSMGSQNSIAFGSAGQAAWDKVGTAGATAGGKIERAADGAAKKTSLLSGSVNVLRMALNFLVAGGIFAVINAFQQMFTMAINGLRELETATYNLVNAERTLSEQGIDITPKGLDETIKKLQSIDPLLSRIQATELVSRTASLVAPSVGFDAKEVDQLSQAIAVLAIRNKGLGKSFEEVESQVSNAFLSGRVSVGINQLGVKITDQIVKDEALRLGLVKTADEFDNLTGRMESNIKARAMLSVLVQNTNKEIEHLPEYLKTADAQFGVFQARMQDLFTQLGVQFGPTLIVIFGAMADSLGGLIMMLEWAAPLIQTFVVTVSGLYSALEAGMKPQTSLKDFRNALSEGYREGVQDAKDRLKDFSEYADTATADVAESSAENLEKAAENFDKFKEKLDDIITDFNRKREDLDIQQGRKFEDLDIEYTQKNSDAEQDYQDKIEDINRQSQQKIADIKRSHREEELRAEQDQTNKLLELRQKYLMNLQDALRARDALQVLKLQQEYEIEKGNLERTSKISKQKRAEDTKEDIKAAQDDRNRKLEEARIDFERKQRDLEISKQREYATIVQWRAREEDDLKRATTRRLTDLVNEYTLSAGATQQYLNTLLGMIQSFSAQAGLAFQSPFNGVLPYGASPVTQVKAPSGPPAPAPLSGVSGTGGSKVTNGGIGRISGLAEGGSFLATRPRSINVAETSPELITATPLGKAGKDISKLFVDGGMGGNNNSRISLKLMLSRGLEAQLVESAMNNVAFVIEQINGEK